MYVSKKCPFCASKFVFLIRVDAPAHPGTVADIDKTKHAVACHDCNARGPEMDEERKAMDAWHCRGVDRCTQ